LLTNFPGLAGMSQMPGAFKGLAQDGIYLPVKLDPEAPWVSTFEARTLTLANPVEAAAAGPLVEGQLRYYGMPATPPGTDGTFPFYGSPYYGNAYPCQNAWVPAVGGNFMVGSVTTPFQQFNTGVIVFYNLSSTASLTCKLKWGVEMRVSPTSVLAPAMAPSAMVDSLAMAAYSDLAGTLPWAYPSSYNSWDLLVKVLKEAWNAIKPMAAGGLLASGHPAAMGVGAALSFLPSFSRPAGPARVQRGNWDDTPMNVRKAVVTRPAVGRTQTRKPPVKQGRNRPPGQIGRNGPLPF